jgi:hypothetical protein
VILHPKIIMACLLPVKLQESHVRLRRGTDLFDDEDEVTSYEHSDTLMDLQMTQGAEVLGITSVQGADAVGAKTTASPRSSYKSPRHFMSSQLSMSPRSSAGSLSGTPRTRRPASLEPASEQERSQEFKS